MAVLIDLIGRCVAHDWNFFLGRRAGVCRSAGVAYLLTCRALDTGRVHHAAAVFRIPDHHVRGQRDYKCLLRKLADHEWTRLVPVRSGDRSGLDLFARCTPLVRWPVVCHPRSNGRAWCSLSYAEQASGERIRETGLPTI